MTDGTIINTKAPRLSEHEQNVLFIEFVLAEVKALSRLRYKELLDDIIKDCKIPSLRQHRHKMLVVQTYKNYTKPTLHKVDKVAKYLEEHWGFLYLKFCKEYEIN